MLLASVYLADFLAVPMLHWLTLVANRREHRVSWNEVARGDMFTNIRLEGRGGGGGWGEKGGKIVILDACR